MALDKGDKIVALGRAHADAADMDIGDLWRAVAVDEIPIDLDAAGVLPDDPAVDTSLLAKQGGAGDVERLAAVLAEQRRIGADDVLLKQPEKFLPLLGRRIAPIGAEDKLADRRQIEVVAKQL